MNDCTSNGTPSLEAVIPTLASVGEVNEAQSRLLAHTPNRKRAWAKQLGQKRFEYSQRRQQLSRNPRTRLDIQGMLLHVDEMYLSLVCTKQISSPPPLKGESMTADVSGAVHSDFGRLHIHVRLTRLGSLLLELLLEVCDQLHGTLGFRLLSCALRL